MTKNMGYSYELAMETSSRYSTKTAFISEEFSLYKWASRRGFWADMTRHMAIYTPEPDWTEAKIAAAAIQYATKSEFIKACPGAYARARKLSILDKVCRHMTRPVKEHGFVVGRECKICKIYKPRAEMRFAPRAKSGISTVCKECESKRGCAIAKKNPAKKNAYTASRRAMRRNAMPSWISKDEKKQIENLYRKAKAISNATGITHEVDHIIPLAGKNVCGLHLAINLRIVTQRENREKLNKFVEFFA